MAVEMECGICGGTHFTARRVLWDALIKEWQISPEEASYIDRQQGECCNGCGANLRSIALANALRAYLGTTTLLRDVAAEVKGDFSILELNEAGTLSPILKRFPGYAFGAYPQVDMHSIPCPDGSFDVVIHSDTLEHVSNPVHALGECRRILKPNGALCLTVPVIVGRLSRSREGLPKSHHGNAATSSGDFVVHTEFGADAWTCLMQAGFTNVSIHAVSYPAATAFLARNGWAAVRG